MTAEHHEAKAPALFGDKKAECQQQGASTGNAEGIGRGRPQGPADDIALLATRGKRQRGKPCQAKREGREMIHLALSLEATVIGACRFGSRLD